VVSEENFDGGPQRFGKSGIRQPAVDSRPMNARQPSSRGYHRPPTVGVEEPSLSIGPNNC
jgi:hypothetical protein